MTSVGFGSELYLLSGLISINIELAVPFIAVVTASSKTSFWSQFTNLDLKKIIKCTVRHKKLNFYHIPNGENLGFQVLKTHPTQN